MTRYDWAQNSSSLLDRGDAATVFPLCREHGLGYEAFGPLAGGWLTGKYRRGEPYPQGSRMTQRPESYLGYATDETFDGLEAFERESLGRGVSMARLAIAWLLSVSEVTAVVVGPHARRAARARARGARPRPDLGGPRPSARLVRMRRTRIAVRAGHARPLRERHR